jgi:uncharacterized protein
MYFRCYLRAALVALTVALIGAGCREPANNPNVLSDTVRMRIGDETFTLEIADSKEEQQRGLMARESMPDYHGMIFVFPGETEHSFWMKDTLIPLDIIFIDAWGRVVSVKGMVPRDLTPVRSDGPAMYAIELNSGAAARARVKPGDTLEIPAEIRKRHGYE